MNACFEEKIYLLLKVTIQQLFCHCEKRAIRRDKSNHIKKAWLKSGY